MNTPLFNEDDRVVMTLDAGGTNLVFSALQYGNEIVAPVTLPCFPNDLERCLEQIVLGLEKIIHSVSIRVHAISFAFPGPADYPNGIIGDLPNFPAFRGGVPLGPFLEEHFQIPVYINNDGNLFALGEYTFGFLPWVNKQLAEIESSKVYRNLIGLTLGTGFGCGLICNGHLNIGDNANGGEIWLMRNGVDHQLCNEGGIGRDKLKDTFAQRAGVAFKDVPEPDVLFQIAEGQIPGNREAAASAFQKMGRVLGEAIANTVTLIDGLVVLGGGLSGAHSLFMPSVMEAVNGSIGHYDGTRFPRLAFKGYFLDDPNQLKDFIRGRKKTISIPGSEKTVSYDDQPRTGIGISKLGVSRAVGLGAYIYALRQGEHKIT